MEHSCNICRFCYNTYEGNYLSEIQDNEINILQALGLTLDLSITENPVICFTCKAQLHDCDSLKKTCISTSNCINPEKNQGIVCRLCMGSIANYRMLQDMEKEQVSIFFPDVNLSITSSVVFCTKCYALLQKYLNFANMCLEWENKLVNMKNFLGHDKISLENFVQSLKYCDKTKEEFPLCIKEEKEETIEHVCLSWQETEQLFIKQENDLVKIGETAEIIEGTNSENESGIKQEINEKTILFIKVEETHNVEMHLEERNGIKTEMDKELSNVELIIKEDSSSEDARLSRSEGATHNMFSKMYENETKENSQTAAVPLNTKMYKCKECAYEGKRKHHLESHVLYRHTDPSKIKMYNCEQCDYKSSIKNRLKNHVLARHTDPPQVKMYKCEQCLYESQYKSTLQTHVFLKHPAESSQVPVHECKQCEYQTKVKSVLQKHVILKHTDLSKQMYKCAECDYEGKMKIYLERHILRKHTNPSEIKMYKCEQCKYESNCKSNLQSHIVLKHMDSSLVTIHKCKQCDYETKVANVLKRHVLLKHTDLSEQMYKCTDCDYEGKMRINLENHILRKHTDSSQVEMYKCEICSFESRYKKSLQAHIIVKHTQASQLTMYKCDQCDYECKLIELLRKHVKKHSDSLQTQKLFKKSVLQS